MRAKKEAWESPFILSGVQKNVREWTFTLSKKLPLWELESRWTSKFLESNCKGQNSLYWGNFYIIGKLLERRCLKRACVTHLNTQNTSYGQKKGWESNLQFNSQALKVKNHPNFLACTWHAHTIGKLSTRIITLLQTSYQSEICRENYGPPKSRESQVWEFWDPHLGVPRQNVIWMWDLWRGT